MKILEIPPEKNINITKYDFTCDDLDDTIPEPLPRQSFMLVINGKPGSGKTTLLLSLLTKRGKAFNRKFDKVYLWGASFKSIKNNPFANLPEEQKFDVLDLENLQSVLDEINCSGEKVLFVMDDVVNDLTKNAKLKNLMAKVCMNRRHLTSDGESGSVSIILSSQVFNRIPAPIRKCASHIILYATKNKKEIETIFDEVITIPKSEYFEIMRYCFDKQHNFMYIDTQKSDERMFHKNFNKLEFQLPSAFE